MYSRFLLLAFATFTLVLFSQCCNNAYAENFTVNIPFGAYNPNLDTPAEVWYDPPVLNVKVGDSVTWTNGDREGHTVTSGQGTGRFEWMSQKQGGFGTPDGIFDSGRFLPNESWTYKFDKPGSFPYFCVIHPWMSGVVNVEQAIPDYPQDAKGNRIDKFPIIQLTPDKLVEFDLTWEPGVIKTFEKTTFVFQTYDPSTNSNVDKMSYEMIITQNGQEVFRDSGETQIGGDYRNVIFDKPGPIEIRFQNIVSAGTSAVGGAAREAVDNPEFRTVVYTTTVYDNPDKTSTTETVVQPAKRLDIYYEILVAVIVVPAIMLGGIVFYMKFKKSKYEDSSYSGPV